MRLQMRSGPPSEHCGCLFFAAQHVAHSGARQSRRAAAPTATAAALRAASARPALESRSAVPLSVYRPASHRRHKRGSGGGGDAIAAARVGVDGGPLPSPIVHVPPLAPLHPQRGALRGCHRRRRRCRRTAAAAVATVARAAARLSGGVRAATATGGASAASAAATTNARLPRRLGRRPPRTGSVPAGCPRHSRGGDRCPRAWRGRRAGPLASRQPRTMPPRRPVPRAATRG